MRSLTGVGAVLCAAHFGPDGRVHGHTWEVTAWFEDAGEDACHLYEKLRCLLCSFDHAILPPKLSRGEDIARFVGENLDCHQVDVSRGAERIYARWKA